MTEEQERAKRTTVNVSQQVADEVLGVLAETNYMGLKEASNTDAMLYAAAVGWDKRMPSPLGKVHSGGYTRTEYFTDKQNALIHVMHLAETGFAEPDTVNDINEGLHVLEEYANGGFNLIAGELADDTGPDVKATEIISDLNGRYQSIFGVPADAR